MSTLGLQRLYSQSCMACHELGLGGAPVIRSEQLAIIGRNESRVKDALNVAKSKQSMHFNNFHCNGCSDSDLIELTRYMASGKRNLSIKQKTNLPEQLQPLASYASSPSPKSLLKSKLLDVKNPYISIIDQGDYNQIVKAWHGDIAQHFTDLIELYSYHCKESYAGELKSHQLTYIEQT